MLSSWIPYKIALVEGSAQVYWLDLEDRFILEPFFDETIQVNKCAMKRRSPFISVCDLQSLCDWADKVQSVPLSALIFHVSRCGSTLLSQCLSADKKDVVIAEAPLLDEILFLEDNLLPPGISREQLFKAAIRLLGQRRLGQKQLFIKLDSWHIYQYNLLRGWFSNIPFYFLSREPKAIIRSHEKRRGIQMIPGYLSEKANPVQVAERHYRDFSLFTADVLMGYYKQLIAVKSKNNPLDRFYDYALGMQGLLADFDAHVGTRLSETKVAVDRLNKHSKYPDQVFEEREETCNSSLYKQSFNSYSQYYQLLCLDEKV